jgi:hypothetical protein
MQIKDEYFVSDLDIIFIKKNNRSIQSALYKLVRILVDKVKAQ